MKTNPKLIALACVIGLAAGCQPAEPGLGRQPSVKKDPCAERLHDICGHLLLYYSTHGKLPPTPAELTSDDGLPLPPLVCPASGKPYVYNPDGVSIPNLPGRLVLYDPEPSHSGMRWGILVAPSADGASITARVILTDAAVPKSAEPSQQAKITAAQTDLSNLEMMIDVFEVDCARYPTTEQGLNALVERPADLTEWKGPYLRRGVPKDPWGNPYVYLCPGRHNTDGYDLSSFGPDGQEGGGDDIDNWSGQ